MTGFYDREENNPGMKPKPASIANPERIREVITGQKLMVYSILVYFCAAPVIVGANGFLDGTPENPKITLEFVICLLAGYGIALLASGMAAYGVLKMGKTLFPGSTRIMYAIGLFLPVPLLGLIIMLVASSKATGFLREQGITVGFFGAKH